MKKLRLISFVILSVLTWSTYAATSVSQPVNLQALMQQYANNTEKPSDLVQHQKYILVFVSFSMPQDSLKEWIMQANTIGAPVLLRGLVNNSFKDTAQSLQTVLTDQGGGIQIDPPAFERYHITQVPAVVIQSPSEPTDYDVIFGNVSLTAALDTLALQGSDTTVTIAQQAAQRLKGQITGATV